MIDRSLAGLLSGLRERKAGDVFRYVRYGELNKAQLALGSVDAIDEILRYFDFPEGVETRGSIPAGTLPARKNPQRVSVDRQHNFPNLKNKESKYA